MSPDPYPLPSKQHKQRTARPLFLCPPLPWPLLRTVVPCHVLKRTSHRSTLCTVRHSGSTISGTPKSGTQKTTKRAAWQRGSKAGTHVGYGTAEHYSHLCTAHLHTKPLHRYHRKNTIRGRCTGTLPGNPTDSLPDCRSSTVTLALARPSSLCKNSFPCGSPSYE